MKTTPALRRELAAYREDLARRTRKVRCPRCGAKPNAPCRMRGGRESNSLHAARKEAAKLAGHLFAGERHLAMLRRERRERELEQRDR